MADKSPAEQLAELKKRLDEDLAKGADLAKEVESLKARIAELAKTASEIDQKEKAWDKAAAPAAAQKKDAEAYIAVKKPMLEAIVPNKDDLVDAKAKGEKRLADLDQQAHDQTAAVAAAEQAYATAKADTLAKQAAYGLLARAAALNEAWLKDIAALRAAADKEGAANHNGRMYLLLLFMEDVVKKIDLRTAADYVAALNKAGAATSAAADAERTAKDALATASADRDQAQRDLDAARATLREDVLKAVPAAPAPAPAPA